MAWVDPRVGLGLVIGLDWVGSTEPKVVLYFYENYIKLTEN